MKITTNFINRAWTIEINGKEYFVDYTNADFQALVLSNRNYWEVTDSKGNSIETSLENKIIKLCLNNLIPNKLMPWAE